MNIYIEKQQEIHDILQELTLNALKFVNRECGPDEFECKYCEAYSPWYKDKEIIHKDDCVHKKALKLLRQLGDHE